MLTVMLLLVAILLTLLALWLFARAITGVVRLTQGAPPFVPLPSVAVSVAVDALDLRDDDTVFDLGCGDGRILKEVLRRAPGSRAVGVEHDIVPWMLARINLRREIAAGRCQLVRGDFYRADVRPATKIFLYLFPKTMDALLPKLRAELQPGVTVVSADFKFTGMEPVEMKVLHDRLRRLGREIRVYRF